MVLFPEGKPVKKETFEQYRASGGYTAVSSHRTPAGILDEITASGLKGRGGACFPVGRKWKVAAETAVTQRHIVCNASEEPATKAAVSGCSWIVRQTDSRQQCRDSRQCPIDFAQRCRLVSWLRYGRKSRDDDLLPWR